MPKAYQLTINKISDWGAILEYLQSLTSINYMIACREFAPKTQKEHYHVYIQFKYSMTLAKKKLLSAHIEVCRGSPQQNIDYIRKHGDIILEEGEARLGGGGFSIKEVKAMTDAEREELSFNHYNKIQNLKRDELCTLRASEYYKNVEVYYIYGLSGTGKTKHAIQGILDLYRQKKISSDKFNEVKYCGNFWNGVSIDNMTEVALYDDFRDYHITPSEFINFIDYNVHVMNIKYGFVMNKFKYIFITSIQSPYDLFRKKKKSNIFGNLGNLKSNSKSNYEIGDDSDDENYEESKAQWIRRISQIVKVSGEGLEIKMQNMKIKVDTQSDKKIK